MTPCRLAINQAKYCQLESGDTMANRDEVFVAGGQPTVTYVDRQEFHVEALLKRALATPNQVVSLAGPTKTGKTVLCKRVLGEREYVWIDGGSVTTADQVWSKVCYELNIPFERQARYSEESTIKSGINLATVVSASGSKLKARESSNSHRIDGMAAAIDMLLAEKIVLVIDDFHYLEASVRTELMRNLKGAVFNGVKVLLLSVTHRAFDAITAESEMTGRFISVVLPEWTEAELAQIPKIGFVELKVNVPVAMTQSLVSEAQNSPFLMQKFCWEICFDHDIEKSNFIFGYAVPDDYDLHEMFVRIAKDAGLPIYQTLVKGPQGKERTKRPLKTGGEADIYEVILQALADTGPKSTISYEEVRSRVGNMLSDMVPQGHEITSALKHLASISVKARQQSAIDWDDDRREINLADPYLRFYLRWQVREDRPQ